MSRFKPGDRVVVVKTKRFHDLVGAVTTVLGSRTWPSGLGYELDIPERDPAVPFANIWSRPDSIEPYRDDGNERGEWDELAIRCCKKGKVSA